MVFGMLFVSHNSCSLLQFGAMANIWPAESTNGDPRIGGFVVQFPSGALKQAAWNWGAPIGDTKTAAKEFAVMLVQHLMNKGLESDIRETNWASMTAAIQKVIGDWNDQLRTRLYTDATPSQ